MAKGYKTGGRSNGTPNKVTNEVKEAIKMLIESNVPNLEKWLNRIAVSNPEKAFSLYISLLEYCIPKLQRSQLDLDCNGNDINIPLIHWIETKTYSD